MLGGTAAKLVVKTPNERPTSKVQASRGSRSHAIAQRGNLAPNQLSARSAGTGLSHQQEAQARVIQQAQSYDPRYTVNTNPDAVNGPPS